MDVASRLLKDELRMMGMSCSSSCWQVLFRLLSVSLSLKPSVANQTNACHS